MKKIINYLLIALCFLFTKGKPLLAAGAAMLFTVNTDAQIVTWTNCGTYTRLVVNGSGACPGGTECARSYGMDSMIWLERSQIFWADSMRMPYLTKSSSTMSSPSWFLTMDADGKIWKGAISAALSGYATSSDLNNYLLEADTGVMLSSLWTKINHKQDTLTTGTTAQYMRGNLSLATFPTTVSSFSNDAGYLTSGSIVGKVNYTDTAGMLSPLWNNVASKENTLGFIPYNATNPSGFINSINSSLVTTALGYTPVTNARTITINGSSQDLSSNRTWNVGTITASDTVSLRSNSNLLYASLSGSYSNPSWITSLAYAKLSGAPSLATVATSGSYTDLSNKPTITSGTITSIATTTPITGGTITSTGTIGIQNAAADNATKGAASFDSSYFDSGSGNISFTVNYGTGTVSANAVTINAPRGKITLSSPNIIAGTSLSITLTDSYINSTSTIMPGINSNGSNLTLGANCYIKSQTSGSCVINILNLSLLSTFTTSLIIDYFIVN